MTDSSYLAGQLTQGWNLSIWSRVARLLADGPTEALVTRPTASRRQAQRRLGREQVAALVVDYEAGASIGELTRRYGIRHETATRWLKINGIAIRPAKTIGIPDDQLPTAAELHATGWSYRKIARHYGCSDTTVRKLLKRYHQTADES